MSARAQLLLFLGLLAIAGALYFGPAGGPNGPQADQVAGEARAFNGDDVQVSPDGTQIAFLRGPRFQRDIWIAPLDSPTNGVIHDARALGLATEQGVLQFEWALDGAHIIFRRPFDVLAQVYTVDIASGVAIALNPFEDTTAGDVTLSPRRPNEALLRLGPTPDAAPDLYRVDLASGELHLIEARGPVGEYYTDQDFVVRAGRTLDQYGFTIFARHDTGWEQKLFVTRQPGEQAGVLFLGAEQNFVYILDDEGRDTIALSGVNLTTGERSLIAATEDGDIAGVLRDPASSEIFAYAVTADDDRQVWRALDASYATDIARLNDLATTAPGVNIRVLSQSLDNMVWTIQAGQDFHLFDRASGTIWQITS